MATKAYNSLVNVSFVFDGDKITITDMPVQEAAKLKMLERMCSALERGVKD